MTADRKLKYGGFRQGVVNGAGQRRQRVPARERRVAERGPLRHRRSGRRSRAGLARERRTPPAGASLRRGRRKTRPPGLGEDRGLGWQLASTAGSAGEPLGPAAYGHTGFTGASLFVDPERSRVAVLLSNRLHPDARTVEMNAFRRRFHEIAAALG